MKSSELLISNSSVLVRPLRQLLHDGKPVGSITVFWLTIEGRDFPVATATVTSNNHSVFWPLLPRNVARRSAVGRTTTISDVDHITVNLGSLKVHVTAIAPDGKRRYHRHAWRGVSVRDRNVSLLFPVLVKRAAILGQDLAAEGYVRMPTTDSRRRIEEFIRFAQEMQSVTLRLPRSESPWDYLLYVVYFIHDPRSPLRLTSRDIPFSFANEVSDFAEEATFRVELNPITVRDLHLVVATACPPGTLSCDTAVGFPVINPQKRRPPESMN
jgi:hypothetical protein